MTLCLMILPSTSVLALDDCCDIVSVDPAKNAVVVREIATGRTKTLKISNTRLLEQLRPGMVFGPDAISGIPTAPRVFEPDWLDDCCDFRATLPIPVTSTSRSAKECCNVIHVDKDRGIVTVIDNDTGESLQFSMSDEERQGILDVGSSEIFDVGSKVGRSFSPLEWPPSHGAVGDRLDFPAATSATTPRSLTKVVRRRDAGTISVPNLETRHVKVCTMDSDCYNTASDGYLGKLTPTQRSIELKAGIYRLRLTSSYSFFDGVEVSSGDTTEVRLGKVGVANLDSQVKVCTMDSDCYNTASVGYVGVLTPAAPVLEVFPGTYKLKFGQQYEEDIVVEPGLEFILESSAKEGRSIETVRPTSTPEPKPDPFRAPNIKTAQAICDAVSKDTGLKCKAQCSAARPGLIGRAPDGALQHWECVCE